mmetsp:Transcript_41119/g.96063  ORF Transcript_41119/g.96063 Transcript_41119/m.96063 type:complete len:113 (+) Transcript_41119:337-675(+)
MRSLSASMLEWDKEMDEEKGGVVGSAAYAAMAKAPTKELMQKRETVVKSGSVTVLGKARGSGKEAARIEVFASWRAEMRCCRWRAARRGCSLTGLWRGSCSASPCVWPLMDR